MTMLDQTEVSAWQDLFTSIIEDADSNIMVLNDDFRIITINSGFYWIFLETYGIELKKGTSIVDSMWAVNPALTKLWKSRCKAAMGGTPIKVEDTFEIDGRHYYWEIHFKSDYLPDGSQVISVFSRDITIRKAFQKKIEENEANLRSILNTIDHAIWLVNTEYELIDFNKEFFRQYKSAFGIKLVKGKSIIDLIPEQRPELKEIWKNRYETGLRGRPGKYVDTYLLGGSQQKFEIKTYPIVEDGKVTGLTIYSRNITAQCEAEQLLQRQNDELVKINAELDRFVYSASHDLRAPLMSVKGLLNMIQIDPDRTNQDHYLKLIGTSIEKLDHFISDIIHYSRNSRLDVQPVAIDFQMLIADAIDALKYMDDANAVKSIVHIHQPVPFYSDPSRLSVIFQNIISNAVRYYDKWKESFLKIEIQTNEQEATLIFSDNGIGIAPEYLDKIFKMFFRANVNSKGSGLGLYIVKSTIEKLGGTIYVESAIGVGTTFRIQLPNAALLG